MGRAGQPDCTRAALSKLSRYRQRSSEGRFDNRAARNIDTCTTRYEGGACADGSTRPRTGTATNQTANGSGSCRASNGSSGFAAGLRRHAGSRNREQLIVNHDIGPLQ